MSYRSKLFLAGMFVLLPVIAFGAMPNVTGIKASLTAEKKVQVSWTKPQGEVAYYRVFFSHASILQNSGLYDDFDVADAQDTAHVLQTVPPVDTLYVSVLAVNAQGEESPLFVEEASVKLSAISASSSAIVPSSVAASSAAAVIASSAAATTSSKVSIDDGKLHLLSAEPISATGIVLQFSHAVIVDKAKAQDAFVAKDASGTILRFTRLIIEESKVTIHTEPQVRGKVYLLTVGDGITGKTADNRVLLFDASQGPTLFSGHKDGLEAPTPAMDIGEPANLRLQSFPSDDGLLRVEMSWEPSGKGEVSYLISRSNDGGRTFGPEQAVPATTRILTVNKVPQAGFAVRIRSVAKDATASRGAIATLGPIPLNPAVPAAGSSSSRNTAPVQGNILTPPRSTTLPNSGIGLAAAIGLAGAGTTWMRIYRRKKA